MAAQVCDAMEGAVLGLQEGAMGAAIRAAVDSLAKTISKGFFEQRIHKKKHMFICYHLFTFVYHGCCYLLMVLLDIVGSF